MITFFNKNKWVIITAIALMIILYMWSQRGSKVNQVQPAPRPRSGGKPRSSGTGAGSGSGSGSSSGTGTGSNSNTPASNKVLTSYANIKVGDVLFLPPGKAALYYNSPNISSSSFTGLEVVPNGYVGVVTAKVSGMLKVRTYRVPAGYGYDFYVSPISYLVQK